MSSHRVQPLSEQAMRLAEQNFPLLAAKSGKAAYKTTLSLTGAVVVKTFDGKLVERHLDGSVTFIKSLPPAKRVTSGLVIKRTRQAA